MARKRRGGKNRKPPTAQPPPRQETKEATEAITYASEDDIDSRDDLDDAYDDDDASTAASTTSRSDVSELDGEGSEGYRPGGYHPVRIGDVFHARYTVVEKLGWGHFSTVWACKDADGDALVALKVQKSAAHYADAALDEIDLLRHARRVADDEAKNWNNQGDDPRVASSRVVRLLDHFEHQGPNGRHVCMVFELLGVNLLSVIRKSEYHGLPVDAVRAMTKQICLGLDFLHRKCAIIHTVSDSAWILNLTPSTRVGSVRRVVSGRVDGVYAPCERVAAVSRRRPFHTGPQTRKCSIEKGESPETGSSQRPDERRCFIGQAPLREDRGALARPDPDKPVGRRAQEAQEEAQEAAAEAAEEGRARGGCRFAV